MELSEVLKKLEFTNIDGIPLFEELNRRGILKAPAGDPFSWEVTNWKGLSLLLIYDEKERLWASRQNDALKKLRRSLDELGAKRLTEDAVVPTFIMNSSRTLTPAQRMALAGV